MLNKAQLVEGFRNEFATTRADAERAVAFFFDTMKDELLGGGEVRIKEFGNFSTYTRKGVANARNPFNGEAISYPDKRTTKFKPSAVLVKALND